jgi:hypothetical protein
VFSSIAIDLKERDIRKIGGSDLDNLGSVFCKCSTNSGACNNTAKFEYPYAGEDLRL